MSIELSKLSLLLLFIIISISISILALISIFGKSIISTKLFVGFKNWLLVELIIIESIETIRANCFPV